MSLSHLAAGADPHAWVTSADKDESHNRSDTCEEVKQNPCWKNPLKSEAVMKTMEVRR